LQSELMSRRIGSVLALILLGGATLRGDVIYLKNGNVIVAEKAWEEGDEVKYQVGSSTQTIPLARVKRLQGQKANPADPSHQQPVGVEVIRGMGAPTVISPEPKTVPGSATTATGPNAKSLQLRDAPGFTEALRLQKETGKPIALYFYVDWCPYCARLERSVLTSNGVQQYLKDILYVTVNPQHGEAEEAFSAIFRWTGFPTFLILPNHQ